MPGTLAARSFAGVTLFSPAASGLLFSGSDGALSKARQLVQGQCTADRLQISQHHRMGFLSGPSATAVLHRTSMGRSVVAGNFFSYRNVGYSVS